MQKDTELIAIPWHVQVFFSTFLYQKYQENVLKRLDKYLTFPQWLQTVERSPEQLEDYSEIEGDNDDVIAQDFYFVEVDWHRDWQFGTALIVGTEFSSIQICLGFFSIILISKNEN